MTHGHTAAPELMLCRGKAGQFSILLRDQDAVHLQQSVVIAGNRAVLFLEGRFNLLFDEPKAELTPNDALDPIRRE